MRELEPYAQGEAVHRKHGQREGVCVQASAQ